MSMFSSALFLTTFFTALPRLALCYGRAYSYASDPTAPELLALCPELDPKVYVGYVPRDQKHSGNYTKKPQDKDMDSCTLSCCQDESCNVAFMFQSACFLVKCKSNHACQPVEGYTDNLKKNARMVLVRPVDSGFELGDDYQNDMTEEDFASTTMASEGIPVGVACLVGIDLVCPDNEVCGRVQPNNRSRSGMCQCIKNYERNHDGICVPQVEKLTGAGMEVSLLSQSLAKEPDSSPSSTSSPEVTNATLGHLVVKVESQEIRLPDSNAFLSVYTIPSEQHGDHYVYDWKLLSHPEQDKGNMKGLNTNSITLSDLVEGVYKFKVTVTTPKAQGETYANITVLPRKRLNKPPVAVITPENQSVQLPNTGAVLDGSSSTDDEKIVSYKWELQQGPIGYQRWQMEDTPTLQLKDLIPGNYTFKLTVEDSSGATNWTTTNITVTKETDYPPTANAGQNLIVYLPKTEVTLNGNQSTDDKGIASWEWTLAPSDQDRAVDMQNTHTPYLQISNLALGMYTFVLKVTDTAGQTSIAEVHVLVKEPPNKPPQVNAGADMTISLPQNWVTLDASKSTDEVQISWNWKQLRGPNQASIANPDHEQVNVTGLTKGEYEFLLTVWDQNKNTANDTVVVTVIQSENRRPHADGGGDQTVTLPVPVVILNGSKSSDDVGVVKWEWIRDGSSLASGKVVGNSDKTAILQLTDLVPGHYLFRLRVSDEQGASDENTVSLIVKPDPNLMDMVEVVLNVDLTTITETQKATTMQQLALLLHEEGEVEIHLNELKQQPHSGHAVLIFHVETTNSNGHREVLKGPRVLARLKDKLQHDEGLLQFSALSLDTVVCQNNCSGHGICDQGSRECLCEAFWMENVIRRRVGDGEPNCDWSILYVVIVIFLIILSLIGTTWAGVCLCQHWCQARNKPKKKQHRYSLLDEDQMEMMAKSQLIGSDSDSESDVLFESSRKNRSNGAGKGGPIKGKNGFVKFGQRVKT